MSKDTLDSSTQPVTRKRRADVLFFLLALISSLLLLALLSYSPADPAWSRLGQHSVNNLIGKTGAWSADVLYHGFGYLAYAIPLLTTLRAYLVMRGQPMPGHWSRRPFGLALTLVSFCTLTHMSVFTAAHLPAGSGGVIGDGLLAALQPWFGFVGVALVMVVTAALGLMLFFDFSWLQVFERIGGWVLALFKSSTNKTKAADRADACTVVDTPETSAMAVVEQNTDKGRAKVSKKNWRICHWWSQRAQRKALQQPESKAIDGKDEPLLDFSINTQESPEPPLLVAVPDVEQAEARPVKPKSKPVATDAAADDTELVITPLEKRETGPSKRAQRDLQGSLFKHPQPLPSI